MPLPVSAPGRTKTRNPDGLTGLAGIHAEAAPAALLAYAASANRSIPVADSPSHSSGPSPVCSQRGQCRPESRKLPAQSSSGT